MPVSARVASRCPTVHGPFWSTAAGLQANGAGQWLQEKHGVKSRRGSRNLHLAVDASTGLIVAHTLTGEDGDDPLQVAPLLN